MRPESIGALFASLLIATVVTGCGGGDATDVGSVVENGGNTQGDTQTGTPTLTADPGKAWVEVDGERLTYDSAGSLDFTCDVSADRVQVNFQTSEGRDLLMTASSQGDQWLGNLTFKPGGGAQVQYSATLPGDADPLIVGDGALSFEGTASEVTDFDAANAEDVDVALAVNCETPGGGSDPTAVLGADTYVIPASGAQSFTCSVEANRLDILVNRLSIDDLQLEISARREDGGWIGNVAVYTPDGTFISPLIGEAAGLTVDGAMVSYEGTFTGGPSGDVTGTVSVTCP